MIRRNLTDGPRRVLGADVQVNDVVMHEGRRMFITDIASADNPEHPDWRIAYVNGEIWAVLVPDDPYYVLGRVTSR